MVIPPWPKSVVWYNSDGKVESDEKYRIMEDGIGTYMIEVKYSEACDSGEWKCVVTSSDGVMGVSSCTVDMDGTIYFIFLKG